VLGNSQYKEAVAPYKQLIIENNWTGTYHLHHWFPNMLWDKTLQISPHIITYTFLLIKHLLRMPSASYNDITIANICKFIETIIEAALCVCMLKVFTEKSLEQPLSITVVYLFHSCKKLL